MLVTAIVAVVLFVMTKTPFTKGLFLGKDGEMNSVEQHNAMRFISAVYIGTCILITGIYFSTMYLNSGVAVGKEIIQMLPI